MEVMEIPRKSRAALLVEYGKPLEIRDLPVPGVEPCAILVKVEMVGICGTDIHQWSGALGVKAPLPNIPGHETIGKIVKLGEGRTHDVNGNPLNIGDRVMWAHVECGECFWCKIARQPTCCANRTLYAIHCCDEPPHLWGGYAEYEYIIPRTNVVKIPDELSNDEVIGVACAFRTVVAAYERLGGLEIMDSVVIQGAGPVGLYALLMAIEGGAGKTIVIGAREERLALAKRWGADHTIDIHAVTDPSQRRDEILELTDGRGPDVAVEATGVPEAFVEGLDMIRRGGRYLVVGQSSGDKTVEIAPALLMMKHLKVIGSISATIPHFYKAIQFTMKHRNKYSFADIVTNKYSLEQANEALAAAKAKNGIKTVIVP
jgi:threonine dehydrogenase-like Zn-dependent dehydrogenase